MQHRCSAAGRLLPPRARPFEALALRSTNLLVAAQCTTFIAEPTVQSINGSTQALQEPGAAFPLHRLPLLQVELQLAPPALDGVEVRLALRELLDGITAGLRFGLNRRWVAQESLVVLGDEDAATRPALAPPRCELRAHHVPVPPAVHVLRCHFALLVTAFGKT